MRHIGLWLLLAVTAGGCPLGPYGDLNCDGRVDLADLAIMAANWLRTFQMNDYPEKILWDGTGIYERGDDVGGNPAWEYQPAQHLFGIEWDSEKSKWKRWSVTQQIDMVFPVE